MACIPRVCVGSQFCTPVTKMSPTLLNCNAAVSSESDCGIDNEGRQSRTKSMANLDRGDAFQGGAHWAPILRVRDLQLYCSKLTARELCRPVTLGCDNVRIVDELAGTRVKLAKGDTLYGVGDRCSALYVVRLG